MQAFKDLINVAVMVPGTSVQTSTFQYKILRSTQTEDMRSRSTDKLSEMNVNFGLTD